MLHGVKLKGGDVKRAYNLMLKRCHPDQNKMVSGPRALQIMDKLRVAMETALKDIDIGWDVTNTASDSSRAVSDLIAAVSTLSQLRDGLKTAKPSQLLTTPSTLQHRWSSHFGACIRRPLRKCRGQPLRGHRRQWTFQPRTRRLLPSLSIRSLAGSRAPTPRQRRHSRRSHPARRKSRVQQAISLCQES